ncbi:hypothetical protein B4U25_05530, partial [Klebsiella pneumoniae]
MGSASFIRTCQIGLIQPATECLCPLLATFMPPPLPVGRGVWGTWRQKAGITMNNRIKSLALLVNLGIYGVAFPLSA